MRRPSFTLSHVVVIAFALTCLAQEDQRTQDWKRGAELFSTYFQDLNSKYSFNGHENEYLEKWSKWQADLLEYRAEIQKKYGSTPEEVAAKFEGVDPPAGVGNAMRQIASELLPFDFAAKQKEIAGWSVEAGNQAYTKWQNFTPADDAKKELKVDYARRALVAYERAAKIDPEGSYTESLDKAKQAIAESEKVWKAAIAGLKWPGHNANFEGPGDPDTLAEEALKLLASVDSWSKPEYDDEHIPVSACITAKGWVVHKTTPITKVPTQYSLDALVAFKGTQDPEIAYAYNMVFYTREEEGVQKEPPFRFVNSRQYAKYKMLMANVPKMVEIAAPAGETKSVEGEPEEPSASAGFLGWTLRLLLGVLLVAMGLACVESLAKLKSPALAGVFSGLQKQRQALGVAALVVGLICLLRTTILHFAPHADLLPQLMAIGLGLHLGHESLPKGLGEKVQGLVKALTPRTELLGIVALVLGLLHLILAGTVLL